MPTIVAAIATAVSKCPIASQIPHNRIQMMLPINAPVRTPGLSTIVRPNGHSAYEAIRSDANPNGMGTHGHDQQEADQRGHHISEGQPQTTENQPDDIQDQAHGLLQPTQSSQRTEKLPYSGAGDPE